MPFLPIRKKGLEQPNLLHRLRHQMVHISFAQDVVLGNALPLTAFATTLVVAFIGENIQVPCHFCPVPLLQPHHHRLPHHSLAEGALQGTHHHRLAGSALQGPQHHRLPHHCLAGGALQGPHHHRPSGCALQGPHHHCWQIIPTCLCASVSRCYLTQVQLYRSLDVNTLKVCKSPLPAKDNPYCRWFSDGSCFGYIQSYPHPREVVIFCHNSCF